jgi:hypothetical protein
MDGIVIALKKSPTPIAGTKSSKWFFAVIFFVAYCVGRFGNDLKGAKSLQIQ